MNGQRKGGIGIFLVLALAEHLIFTVVLAMAVYTKPTSKPDNFPIPVEILTPASEQERLEPEFPIAIPPRQRVSVPEELPLVHSKHSVQRYLDSPQSTAGLPKLPATRTGDRNAARLSLGALPSQGRNRDLLDDLESTHATVRQKPLVEQSGHQGASERHGALDAERHQKLRGESGTTSAGNVSPGSAVDVGPNRITGDGGIEFEISGEVSGRGFRLGRSIQTEGKQGGGVQLTFKVRPDGTVYNVRIKPGPRTTVGEVRLKEEARRYVERIRFDALPKSVPQVDQSGEIFINFTTQMSR